MDNSNRHQNAESDNFVEAINKRITVLKKIIPFSVCLTIIGTVFVVVPIVFLSLSSMILPIVSSIMFFIGFFTFIGCLYLIWQHKKALINSKEQKRYVPPFDYQKAVQQHFGFEKPQKSPYIPTNPFSTAVHQTLIKDRYFPVRQALMNWYRSNAIERLGPSGIGGGICDDGMCDLSQSIGNVFLRPGGYLCCEICTINFLNSSYTDWDKALANIESYFGPGVPQSVHQAVRLCR